MTAALDLGYTPVGDYATTVIDEVEWLVATARSGGATASLPGLDDPFFGPMLDYAAEDLYLATRLRPPHVGALGCGVRVTHPASCRRRPGRSR
jgi:hypothetical protein